MKIRCALIVAVAATSVAAAQPPTATIQRPKTQTVSGGMCRVSADGVLGVNIGPNASVPTLALTVGPSPMADMMKANKARYTGPGTYANEIVALYLGTTATDDTHIGLGTVTVNADGKSGAFELNDHTGVGTFDCGAPPAKP